MEIFIPATHLEREALLRRDVQVELSGVERLAWDATGVEDDASWVAAEVHDETARRYEASDGTHFDYRSFDLPADVLNALSWRVVEAAEIAAARTAEADAIERASDRARAEALEQGRRLGLIE